MTIKVIKRLLSFKNISNYTSQLNDFLSLKASLFISGFNLSFLITFL